MAAAEGMVEVMLIGLCGESSLSLRDIEAPILCCRKTRPAGLGSLEEEAEGEREEDVDFVTGVMREKGVIALVVELCWGV